MVVWLGGDGDTSFSCVCDALLDRTAKMEVPQGMSVVKDGLKTRPYGSIDRYHKKACVPFPLIVISEYN